MYLRMKIERLSLVNRLTVIGALCLLEWYVPVQSTPMVSLGGTKRLDKPGLFLSSVTWRQPETGSSEVLTFRVYCPTAMMRDVTSGKWKTAYHLSVMEGMGYPTGVPRIAYEQACRAK